MASPAAAAAASAASVASAASAASAAAEIGERWIGVVRAMGDEKSQSTGRIRCRALERTVDVDPKELSGFEVGDTVSFLLVAAPTTATAASAAAEGQAENGSGNSGTLAVELEAETPEEGDDEEDAEEEAEEVDEAPVVPEEFNRPQSENQGSTSLVWDSATGQYIEEDLPDEIKEMMGLLPAAAAKPVERPAPPTSSTLLSGSSQVKRELPEPDDTEEQAAEALGLQDYQQRILMDEVVAKKRRLLEAAAKKKAQSERQERVLAAARNIEQNLAPTSSKAPSPASAPAAAAATYSARPVPAMAQGSAKATVVPAPAAAAPPPPAAPPRPPPPTSLSGLLSATPAQSQSVSPAPVQPAAPPSAPVAPVKIEATGVPEHQTSSFGTIPSWQQQTASPASMSMPMSMPTWQGGSPPPTVGASTMQWPGLTAAPCTGGDLFQSQAMASPGLMSPIPQTMPAAQPMHLSPLQLMQAQMLMQQHHQQQGLWPQ